MLYSYESLRMVCANCIEEFGKEYQEYIDLFREQGIALEMDFVYQNKKKQYQTKPYKKGNFVLRCRFSLFPNSYGKTKAKAYFVYQMFYVDLILCKEKNKQYTVAAKKSFFPKRHLDKILRNLQKCPADQVLSQKYTDIVKWFFFCKRYEPREQRTIRGHNLSWIYLTIIIVLILLSTIATTRARYL